MATLGRRSHDTRPPSPLPPPSNAAAPPDVFSEETPRAPSRIPSDEEPQQKRLALFTEMLSSGASSLARGPAQLLPGSRSHNNNSHSRADSQLRENAGSPAPAMAPSTSGGASYLGVHTSPSKVRDALSGGGGTFFLLFSFCPPVPPSRGCAQSIRFLCASFQILPLEPVLTS
jgi:hypothetical protein